MPLYEAALDVILNDWFPSFINQTNVSLWKLFGDPKTLISSKFFIKELYQQQNLDWQKILLNNLTSGAENKAKDKIEKLDNYHLIKLVCSSKNKTEKTTVEEFACRALDFFLSYYAANTQPLIGTNFIATRSGFQNFFAKLPISADQTADVEFEEIFKKIQQAEKIRAATKLKTPTKTVLNDESLLPLADTNLLLAYKLTQITMHLFTAIEIAKKIWVKHEKTWPKLTNPSTTEPSAFPPIPADKLPTPRATTSSSETVEILVEKISPPKASSSSTSTGTSFKLPLEKIIRRDSSTFSPRTPLSPTTPHSPTTDAPPTERVQRELQRNVCRGLPEEPARNQRTLYVPDDEQAWINELASKFQSMSTHCAWLSENQDTLSSNSNNLRFSILNTIRLGVDNFITTYELNNVKTLESNTNRNVPVPQ